MRVSLLSANDHRLFVDGQECQDFGGASDLIVRCFCDDQSENIASVTSPHLPKDWMAKVIIQWSALSRVRLFIDDYNVLSIVSPIESFPYYISAFSQDLSISGDLMSTLVASVRLPWPRTRGSWINGAIQEIVARDLKLTDHSTFSSSASAPAMIEATGVFTFCDGRLLVGEKDDAHAIVPDRLYVPGGKFEGNETILECARRELWEETGLIPISAECAGVFHHVDQKKQRLYTFYQVSVQVNNDTLTKSDDLINMRWLTLNELSDLHLFHLTRAQLLMFIMAPAWWPRLRLRLDPPIRK